MKPMHRYLDELIDQGIVKNDSETARKLNVSRATVSDWRIGRTTPNDEQAVNLASLLRKDPGELLAECGAARAKSPETRRAWERVAARIASYGVTVCALIMVIGHSEDARASQCKDLLFSELKKRRFVKGLVMVARKMTECITLSRVVLQPKQCRISTVVTRCCEYAKDRVTRDLFCSRTVKG